MSDSAPKQVWVVPVLLVRQESGLLEGLHPACCHTPESMVPWPALFYGKTFCLTWSEEKSVKVAEVALYDRRHQVFALEFTTVLCDLIHDSFEECRAAMVKARTGDLEDCRKRCYQLAQAIEHVRTIPAVPFPEIVMETAPEPPALPANDDGGPVDPSVPYLVGEEKPKTELKRPSRKAQ